MPERIKASLPIVADTETQSLQTEPWEIDSVFVDREHLQGAVSALVAAGFDMRE